MKHSLRQYAHQTWVIGVSGGCDSMALLDLAFHSKINCIVCHVNYQKRESANRDQAIVEAYCRKKNIPIYDYLAPEFKGNFQDAARRFRYQKMKALVKAFTADAMVVAHHQDDDAETILFQKNRASLVETYGLLEDSKLYHVRLLRPLLSFSKQDLLHYCLNHKIPFGEDESNFDLTYTRNNLRKELELMPSEERERLFQIKDEYNNHRLSFLKRNHQLLQATVLKLKDHQEIIDLEFLTEWLRYQKVHTQISKRFVEELLRQIRTSKRFDMLYGNKRILMQYQTLYILPKTNPHYHFEIERQKDLKTSFFELQFVEQAGITLKLEDFPLHIIDASSVSDLSALNLNRWFIKHKIPLHHRELWPILICGKSKRLCVDFKSHYDGARIRKIHVSMVK